MDPISTTITYFPKAGKQNTDLTLKLAFDRAKLLGVRKAVIATTLGDTPVKAAAMRPDLELIAVSHVAGFKEPNTQEMTPENQHAMTESGIRIITAQHAFGGVGRAVRVKFQTWQVNEIISATLKLLGQGYKVACEIALMAADAGAVRTDEPVLSIAGTGLGADTALIVLPAYSHAFFDLKILEIICLPSPDHPGKTD